MASPPPWNVDPWQRGPVPVEIGKSSEFGELRAGANRVENRPNEYRGDKELVRLFSSERIWYAARERGSKHMRWHNGDLLILDPDRNQVWYCAWDY